MLTASLLVNSSHSTYKTSFQMDDWNDLSKDKFVTMQTAILQIFQSEFKLFTDKIDNINKCN